MATGTTFAAAVAASPAGNDLYVALPSSIAQYAIGAGGTLPSTPSSSIDTTATTESIAVSPDDRHLYLSDDGGSPGPGVWQYNIGAGGGLTLLSAPSASNGTMFSACPGPIAISSDSQHVYVSSPDCSPSAVTGGIREYSVGPSGGLVFDASFPAVGVTDLAITPDGSSMYAAAATVNGQLGATAQGAIYEFSIGTGGALTPKSTASVSPGTNFSAGSIAVSPNGTSAYATANKGDCNASPTLEILQYSIGTGGLLSPKTPATVEPAVGDNVGNVAISPDGSSVYATSDGSCSGKGGNILQYSVGAGGVLSPDSPAAVAVGTNPFGLAVVGAAPTETLTVSLAGAGAGLVTGSGISCPGTCSHGYAAGTTVTLSAAPGSNSTFAGWSGAGCSGKGNCTVTLNSAQAVSATFDKAAAPAPVCTLAVRSDTVVLKAPKHENESAKPGTLALTARCNEDASLRLTGTLVELLGKKPKHGKQKTKSFALGPLRATCKAGKPTTLTIKLPALALHALGAKANEFGDLHA